MGGLAGGNILLCRLNIVWGTSGEEVGPMGVFGFLDFIEIAWPGKPGSADSVLGWVFLSLREALTYSFLRVVRAGVH